VHRVGMCWSVLQCDAVGCSVSQCDVADAHVTIYELEAASTDYFTACYSMLQSFAVSCSVLQCLAM